MGRIIVIEDNPVFADYVCCLLENKGYQSVATSTCNGARKLFAKMQEDDIVLADMRLPDGDGIALLEELRKQGRNNPYIVMTDYDEVPTAVRSMKLGAEDYIPKKLIEVNLFPLLKTLQKRMERHETPIYERQSAAFREIDHKIKLVATTNMSVLILGESGTGKEHIAEKIHSRSKRSGKPFVAIDCGSIPAELAGSEFFGHTKGSFTGALSDKIGAFEAANGGTVFLDEVGNLGYETQMHLLRALQERKIKRIGSNKEIEIDIRLVAATNEDLEKAISKGAFRNDLYHRISEFTIHMPELKDLKQDIMLYANFFLDSANRELGKNVIGFDDNVMQLFLNYDWPGNLRQMKNTVMRATLLTQGEYITMDSLPRELSLHKVVVEKSALLHDPADEKERILSALKNAGGNKSMAAKLLGVDRKTLYNKLKLYDIE